MLTARFQISGGEEAKVSDLNDTLLYSKIICDVYIIIIVSSRVSIMLLNILLGRLKPAHRCILYSCEIINYWLS